MKEVALSKERFCEIIDRLYEADQLQQEVERLFRNSRDNILRDFCNVGSLQICHEGIVIDLLERIMDDTAGDISYFVYELDYGKRYHPGCITEKINGKDVEIDLSTAGKLYDYLIRKI